MEPVIAEGLAPLCAVKGQPKNRGLEKIILEENCGCRLCIVVLYLGPIWAICMKMRLNKFQH
jgi:hypothetical protein